MWQLEITWKRNTGEKDWVGLKAHQKSLSLDLGRTGECVSSDSSLMLIGSSSPVTQDHWISSSTILDNFNIFFFTIVVRLSPRLHLAWSKYDKHRVRDEVDDSGD